MKLAISATNTVLFNASYRNCIAFTESQINRIMQKGVFCAHKPYFLMPGHIRIIYGTSNVALLPIIFYQLKYLCISSNFHNYIICMYMYIHTYSPVKTSVILSLLLTGCLALITTVH